MTTISGVACLSPTGTPERTVVRDREIGCNCFVTIIGGRTPVEYMTDLDDLLKSALAAQPTTEPGNTEENTREENNHE